MGVRAYGLIEPTNEGHRSIDGRAFDMPILRVNLVDYARAHSTGPTGRVKWGLAIEIVNTIFIIYACSMHVLIWVSVVVEVLSSTVEPTDTGRGVCGSLHHPRKAIAVL